MYESELKGVGITVKHNAIEPCSEAALHSVKEAVSTLGSQTELLEAD
jgi:hypothetical protein